MRIAKHFGSKKESGSEGGKKRYSRKDFFLKWNFIYLFIFSESQSKWETCTTHSLCFNHKISNVIIYSLSYVEYKLEISTYFSTYISKVQL